LSYEVSLLSEEILKGFNFSLAKDFKDIKITGKQVLGLIVSSDLLIELHKRPSTILKGNRFLSKKFDLSDGNKGSSNSFRIFGIADKLESKFYLAKIYRKSQQGDIFTTQNYHDLKRLKKEFEKQFNVSKQDKIKNKNKKKR